MLLLNNIDDCLSYQAYHGMGEVAVFATPIEWAVTVRENPVMVLRAAPTTSGVSVDPTLFMPGAWEEDFITFLYGCVSWATNQRLRRKLIDEAAAELVAQAQAGEFEQDEQVLIEQLEQDDLDHHRDRQADLP
jgi:hypothetical protein